jgi:hypothetical protein
MSPVNLVTLGWDKISLDGRSGQKNGDGLHLAILLEREKRMSDEVGIKIS